MEREKILQHLIGIRKSTKNLNNTIHEIVSEIAREWLKKKYEGIEFEKSKGGGKDSFPDIKSKDGKVFGEVITATSELNNLKYFEPKIEKLKKYKGKRYFFVIDKKTEEDLMKGIKREDEIEVINLQPK